MKQTNLHFPALLGEDGKPEHWPHREPKWDTRPPEEWSPQRGNEQRKEMEAAQGTRLERIARYIFTHAEWVIASAVFVCIEAVTASEMVRTEQWVSGAGVMLVFAVAFAVAAWISYDKRRGK